MRDLQEYKSNLSDEEIDELVAKTQTLIERQDTPDKPEDLAKIPTLKREDLTTEVPDYPLEESSFTKKRRLSCGAVHFRYRLCELYLILEILTQKITRP